MPIFHSIFHSIFGANSNVADGFLCLFEDAGRQSLLSLEMADYERSLDRMKHESAQQKALLASNNNETDALSREIGM